MFVYKKLKASDVSRTPFEAHKQYNITADNTSSLGIDFFSARFSSGSKDTFSLNDPNETKKYFQLDKIYYNKDFGNNIGGLRYEDQETRLYKELNVISIPQGLFGSSIQKNTLNLFEQYIDDSKGNLYNSTIDLSDYPTDKERTLYIAPVKGFKLNDLSKDYTTGYTLTNTPSRLDKILYDDSLYLNTIEYISSSIIHLNDLNCTGIDLTTGYIKSPHNNNINFGQNEDFTISFYYKTPSTLSGTKYLVAKSYSKTVVNSPETGNTQKTGSLQSTEVDAGPAYPFEIYLTNNNINFARADQDIISTITKTSGVNTNTLTHLTFVKSGSELQIYKDGNKIESGSDATTLTKNKANLYIGNRGGSRSEYSSAGGTISQLMVFNKALNSTQISNVSSSIIGSPYIGNVFYENGLVTITSPKFTNNLGNINENASGQITISPTFGTPDDFDIRELQSSGTSIFKSSFKAFTEEMVEENLFNSSSYNIIDFSNTGVGGKFISASNQSGDAIVGEFSLFEPQPPFERDEYFSARIFGSKLHQFGGSYNTPNVESVLNIGSNSAFYHPSASTGGFTPNGSNTSITEKSTVWAISASESTIETPTTIHASASVFLTDDNFPTSDTSLSDTSFVYNDSTTNDGFSYLENFSINGLAMSSSLEDIPALNGFIKRTTALAGTSANGFTQIRVTSGEVSPTTDNIEFRDHGLQNSLPGGDIRILSLPTDTDMSASFKMTIKLTNSDTTFSRNGQFRIVSGSTPIGLAQSFFVPANTSSPISYTIYRNDIGINVDDDFQMEINMNNNSELTLTEAELSIFTQSPLAGKRNKVSLTASPSTTLKSYTSDRTRRYLINFGELHTSASGNSSGPNHIGLLTGSLKLELIQNIQGTNTTLTSSLIPSGTLSSSFTYLYNPGDINNSGTSGTNGNTLNTAGALFTRLKVVDPENTDNLLKTGINEGFTIKNFSIKEISGSTLVSTTANLGSDTSISLDESVISDNPNSPSNETTTIPISSVPGPTLFSSTFPILTIDATGSLIQIDATSSRSGVSNQISASYNTTSSEDGIYIISGLDISHNFTNAFPRIRVYSGSTEITSSFGDNIDTIGSSHTSRLISTTFNSTPNTDNLPTGNSVDLGFIPDGGDIRIELDVVESDGTTLKPTPSDESASFSSLGVFYLTSSTVLRDFDTAEPNFESFNSVQIESPHNTAPFTIGGVTASLLSTVGNSGAIGQLDQSLLITASAPVTQSNTFTAVPFVVEKTYNLDNGARYIISQSLNFNFSEGNRLLYRLIRTEDINTPTTLTGHNYSIVAASETFNSENQWVTASTVIDTINNTGGEYTAQFVMYDIAPSFNDIATLGDSLKLASASLQKFSGSNNIIHTGGDLFDESTLETIKLKTSNNTLPFNVGDSNPKTYSSSSVEINPPSTDEFTFQNASLIQLNSPIFVLEGDGEITGSAGNIYNYYKATSSLNITNGFNSDMEGGIITNLGNYTNTFNISTAASNTMSIDNDIILLTNTNATVNYTTGASIDDFNLDFKNTHLIFEHEYLCTIEEDEYNFSLNPTLRVNKNLEEGELANFATGSNFKPYVTTVGLYNDEGELLVVGKLGQPIKMSDETDTTFVVRYDT